jgi:hypothetical protein
VTAQARVIGNIVGRATIENWLGAQPALSERIVRARGAVVLFEVERHPADLARAIDHSLAAADASVPADVVLPLFVALTNLHDMNEAGMLFGPHRGYAPAPPSRGAFLGYFAIGEGGARFIGGGSDPGERPEQILARVLPQ